MSSARPSPGRACFGVAAVAGGVAVGVIGLVLPYDTALWVSSLTLAFAQGGAGGAILLRRKQCGPGPLERTWLWLGVSGVSSSCIFLVWAAYGFTSGSLPPVPSVADAFFLVAVGSVVPGLLALLPRGSGQWPVRWILDSLIVAVALFVVAWLALLGPALRGQQGSILGTALVIAYPMFDVVAIALATIVALRVRPGTRPVVAWVAGGVMVLATGDVLFSYLSVSVSDSQVTFAVAMALWAAGYPLLAVPLMAGAAEPSVAGDPEMVRSTSVVPNVAATVALSIAVTTDPHPVVSVAAGLLLALVLVRQTIAVRAEGWMNNRLEQTVRERTEELRYVAFHDGLTGLVTREVLANRLEHAFSRRASDRRPASLLVLDIDGFKSVNDTYGHIFGDQVLVAAAARVTSVLRPSDIAARMGGDEFAVLLDGTGASGAAKAAERLLSQFRRPFPLGGHAVAVNASIGIAVSPGGEEVDLLARADVAMYAAKNGGKGQYRLFDAEMHEASLARLRLGAELGVAISERAIEPHYQPIIFMRTGAIVGFEALARWTDRSGDQVSPCDFIPVAEESGLILELGQAILEKASEQLAEWQRRFPRPEPLTMTVNVSARQLQHPGLVRLFGAALATSGVAANSIRLELTESGIIDAPDVISKLHELREAGFPLYIDDFGTGYSSLSYLRRLPIDAVKIDRSLVAGVAAEAEEWVLLRGIIKLIHGLGFATIAEGVERPEQMLHLRSLGCQYAQGYYFSRPLTADAAGEMLAAEVAGALR